MKREAGAVGVIGMRVGGSHKLLTWEQRVAGEEFLGGQAAAAFTLQDQDSQRVTATAHHNAGFVSLQDLAGRSGALDRFRLPDFEQVRLGLGGQIVNAPGQGTRPRTRFQIARAGWFQSIWPSCFFILGA